MSHAYKINITACPCHYSFQLWTSVSSISYNMENSSNKLPLLTPEETPPQLLRRPSHHSFDSSFVADADDIAPITGVRDFYREFIIESRKLWYLAGPAIFTSICQYSLGAITQTFAGHVGTLQLAAFSVENSVIAGLSFGVMVFFLY